MNKREKIIVLIAVVIAVYGVLDYFVLSSGNGESDEALIARQKQDAQAIATNASADIALIRKITGTIDYPYLLQRIQAPWDNDPFILGHTGLETDVTADAETEALPELIYSGFVKIGSTLRAVINGMEYRSGETLKDAGLIIRKITTGKVVLVTKGNKEITLNIEEN
jgi:hypothetical protein